MGRFTRSLLVAIVAITLTSGVAFAASELDIATAGAVAPEPDVPATAAGAYVVGTEWLAAQNSLTVDLGSAIPAPGAGAALRSDILYVPAIDLGVNNTLTITPVNGAVLPSVNYGMAIVGGAQVAQLVDFDADANGNYTRLLIKMTAAVPTGTTLALTENGLTPDGGTNNPVLVTTPADLAAGSMTLQVSSAKDDSGQDLVAPVSNIETVISKAAQLSATVQHQVGGASVNGNATSTIDVESSRTRFVAEADGEDTTLTTSEARVLVATATVNNGVDVSAAAYTLTFNGDQAAIATTTGVKLNGTNMTKGSNVWSITSDFATNDLLTDGQNEILITVDGDVLETANYTVDLTIDPAEAGVADQAALVDATAFVWTINAMQAKVPYLALQAPGYLSFVKVVNESASAADLRIDAVIYNVTDAMNEVAVTDAFVSSIPATSNTTVGEAQIATALGLDPAKIYHVALTVTVVAPQNQIHLSAYQKDAIGRTMVPVLYNTNNANDGRTWQ